MATGSTDTPDTPAQRISQLGIEDLCIPGELTGHTPTPLMAFRDLTIKLLGSVSSDAIRTHSFDPDYLRHLEERVAPEPVQQAISRILYDGDSTMTLGISERIVFFCRMCDIACTAEVPGQLDALIASGPLPPGFAIFSLASDIWTHHLCRAREDTFWMAAFALYPRLSAAPEPARPLSYFPLHTPWQSDGQQDLRKVLQHLLAAEDTASLRNKLIQCLPIDVLRLDFVKHRVLPPQELAQSAAYDFHRTTGSLLRGVMLDRPAHAALQAVLNSRQFLQLASQIVASLDGYICADDEAAAHASLRSLALQGLIDSLYPPQTRIADCILGYHLFEPINAEQSFNEIRFDLLEHIRQELDCPLADAQFIGELMLNCFAPELLLDDAPEDFRYEPDPRWVELRQATALWNDRARKPGFKELAALPQQLANTATTPQEKNRIALAHIQAVLIWAVHEELIVSKPHYPQEEIHTAIRAFDLMCARLFFKLLPNRTYSASQRLMAAGIDPGEDTPDRLASNVYTQLERYLNEGSDYSHPSLGKRALPDPTRLFHEDFDRHLVQAEKLLGSLTDVFLHDIPSRHRQRLLEGDLTFYAASWTYYVGSDEPHLPRTEDWELRRAEQGLIVLVHFDNQHGLYELFPLANRFIYKPVAQDDVQHFASNLLKHKIDQYLALDCAAYYEHPPAHSSFAAIDKLGAGRGATNGERIIDCFTQDIFLFRKAQLRERCMGLTVAETRARQRAAAPFAALWKDIKSIVPLVGCFDVRSGEDAACCLLDVIPELGKPLSALSRAFKATVKTGRRLDQGIRIAPSIYARVTSELFHQGLADARTLARKLASFKPGMGISHGYLQLPDADLYAWQPASTLDRLAEVDGIADIPIRNIGTPDMPDYRRLDLATGQPYGSAILKFASLDPASGASRFLSMQTRIIPGSYPGCLQVLRSADSHSLRIADSCDVRVFAVEAGVFDISIDRVIYRLDSSEERLLARRLDLDGQPFRGREVQEMPASCRVKRALFEICSDPVRLKVEARRFAPSRDLALQQEAALAHQTMEFQAVRLTLDMRGAKAPHSDVMVMEGKFQTWADNVPSAQGRRVVQVGSKHLRPLSSREKTALGLSEQPRYRNEISARLSDRKYFGLRADLPEHYTSWINQQLPVYELNAIAEGLNDQRTLRGIVWPDGLGTEVIIEPDSNVFFKGQQVPGDSITFVRITDEQEIRGYLRPLEYLRLLASRPGAYQDMENLSELIFDIGKTRSSIYTPLSYEKYLAQYHPNGSIVNEMEEQAALVLSGAREQRRHVEIAKGLIPDFQRLGEVSFDRQAHVKGILNQLLPLNGRPTNLPVLTLEMLNQANAGHLIRTHLNGANLAFAWIESTDGQRWVIYALSGGRRTRNLHLKITEPRVQLGETTYLDARAMMQGRSPDPRFTSLPVLRSENRLTVTHHDRALDAERLIATVMGDELRHINATHIHFFTLMDTCQSCGGFVLPRLKLDYSNASFSVTYMLDYTRA